MCCDHRLEGMASSSRGIQIGSAWFQRKINLRPQHRGVHLVTEEILKQIPEISQFSVGLCHIQSKYIYMYIYIFKLYLNRFIDFNLLVCLIFKMIISSNYNRWW